MVSITEHSPGGGLPQRGNSATEPAGYALRRSAGIGHLWRKGSDIL
jgi:hypothetical protein